MVSGDHLLGLSTSVNPLFSQDDLNWTLVRLFEDTFNVVVKIEWCYNPSEAYTGRSDLNIESI